MRKAFTLIELVFVIVVMGILAKFGTNILVTTYSSYTASSINNKLLSDVELTLNQISNRLQYRIKSSMISSLGTAASVNSLQSANANDTVVEWIGYDIDGWLGSAASTAPNWSGFIDVDDAGATGGLGYLESPGTNTNTVSNTIQALNANGSATDISNAAIFFTGENADVTTDYGWYSVAALNTQNNVAAHRITGINVGGSTQQLIDDTAATFAGTDVYENYKLSWTAYALAFENPDADNVGDLFLYYDYQPWDGEIYTDGTKVLLLRGIDTFRFRAFGESLQVQICANDRDSLGAGDGGYSVCEETSIF